MALEASFALKTGKKRINTWMYKYWKSIVLGSCTFFFIERHVTSHVTGIDLLCCTQMIESIEL